MCKKWTKNLAISGQVIGMLLGTTQDNFYGMHSIADFALVLGHGLPFAIIGALIGLFFDYLAKSKPNADTHVKCPDCRELVLKDARKCKHCGCGLILENQNTFDAEDLDLDLDSDDENLEAITCRKCSQRMRVKNTTCMVECPSCNNAWLFRKNTNPYTPRLSVKAIEKSDENEFDFYGVVLGFAIIGAIATLAFTLF